MGIPLLGRRGPVRTALGGEEQLRLGPYSDLAISPFLGQYSLAALNGLIYTTMVKTVTVAATHNSPIAAATATPVVGFVNPINNTKAAFLLRVGFTSTSGTPAGGQAILNAISGIGTSITATVTGSIFNHLLSQNTSPQGSTMRPYNNVALTGLSPTAANEILLVDGATAAAVAGTSGAGVAGEDFGGMLIIPPNTLLALMAGTGAGTSWIVNASLTWMELDWPL